MTPLASVCTDHVLVRPRESATEALVKSSLRATEPAASSRSLHRHTSNRANTAPAGEVGVDDAAVMRAVGVPGVAKAWLESASPATMEAAISSVRQAQSQQQLTEAEHAALTPARRAAMVRQSVVALTRAASVSVPVTIIVLGGDRECAQTVRRATTHVDIHRTALTGVAWCVCHGRS